MFDSYTLQHSAMMRVEMRTQILDSVAGEVPDVRLSNPGVGTQILKAVTAGVAAIMYMHIPTKFSLTCSYFDSGCTFSRCCLYYIS